MEYVFRFNLMWCFANEKLFVHDQTVKVRGPSGRILSLYLLDGSLFHFRLADVGF